MAMHEYRIEVILQVSKTFDYPYHKCEVKDALQKKITEWLDNISFLTQQPEKVVEVTLLEYTENAIK